MADGFMVTPSIRAAFRYIRSSFVTVVSVAAVLLAACGTDDSPDIVIDGESEYRIVVAHEAPLPVMHGALELQRFLFEMTGAEITVETDSLPGAGPEILIGPSKRLTELFPDVSPDSLGPEDYLIRTAGQRLVILGGGPRGTLYGVYGLLEDHLGCRWYTADVSRIPKMEKLLLPDIDETVRPVLEYREPYIWEAFDGDWAARNRVNRNSKDGGLEERHGGKIEWVPNMFAHTFEKLVPPSKYFASHPEYFSLVGGRRTARRSQLCCTNEDVIRIVTEGVISAFREHPQAMVLSVSQNDWDGHCECARCQALAEAEESQMAPVLALLNRVGEAVEREFPGRVVETLAYQWTRKPPKTMRPRGNVVIRLCSIECCFAHPLDTCDGPHNAAFAEDLRAWGSIADRLWIWNYATSFAHYFVPFPNLRVRGPNMRFFVGNHVTAVFQQDVYTTPWGELSGLSAWLQAKLLWNPYIDTEAAIADYLDGVYGPASGPIGAYIDMIHDRVERDNIHMGIWQGPEAEYLPESVLASADSLWIDAEARVAGMPDVLERVRIDRLSVDYTILCRGMTRSTAYIVNHADTRIEVDPAYTARLDRFCGTAERAGVRRLKEYGYTVDEFRADVEKTVQPRTVAYAAPTHRPSTSPGLVYKYYEGEWKKPPDFASLKPGMTGKVRRFRLPIQWTGEGGTVVHGFTLKGVIEIPSDGVYAFSVRSNGYAELDVGGRTLVRNTGSDPLRERCGFVALRAGWYDIGAMIFTRENGDRLEVFIEGPGMPKQEIPAEMLMH